jgi:hypothetical protein
VAAAMLCAIDGPFELALKRSEIEVAILPILQQMPIYQHSSRQYESRNRFLIAETDGPVIAPFGLLCSKAEKTTKGNSAE